MRRLFIGKRCKRGVGGSTRSCEMVFVDIAVPYLTIGMADGDA
jgi:hypothetical protein